MQDAHYQIIAVVPGRSGSGLPLVASELSRNLGVDLSGLLEALGSTGVCVAFAKTLEDAKRKAALVRRCGAEYRIAAPDGTDLETSSPGAELPLGTMLGGFHAPEALEGAVRDISGASEEDLLPLDEASSGEWSAVTGRPSADVPAAPERQGPKNAAVQSMGATIMGTGVSSISGLAGGASSFAPSGGTTENPQTSPPGGAPRPAGPAAAGFPLSTEAGLSEDALVMLDGSQDQLPHLRSVSSLAQPAVGLPPPADLGADLSGPSDLAAPPLADDAAFAPPLTSRPQPIELELAEPRTKPETTQQPTAQPDVVPIPDRAPASGEPAPGGSSSVSRDASPATTAQPQAAERRTKTPTRRTGSARRDVGRAVLFNGKLRRTPRLRILLGFAAALTVGSALPMWQAHHVMSARIHPLRLDLSAVKAHGRQLAGRPGFKSADQLNDRIASIRLRYTVYTFLLWLTSTSLLLFLWFRFT